MLCEFAGKKCERFPALSLILINPSNRRFPAPLDWVTRHVSYSAKLRFGEFRDSGGTYTGPRVLLALRPSEVPPASMNFAEVASIRYRPPQCDTFCGLHLAAAARRQIRRQSVRCRPFRPSFRSKWSDIEQRYRGLARQSPQKGRRVKSVWRRLSGRDQVRGGHHDISHRRGVRRACGLVQSRPFPM